MPIILDHPTKRTHVLLYRQDIDKFYELFGPDAIISEHVRQLFHELIKKKSMEQRHRIDNPSKLRL